MLVAAASLMILLGLAHSVLGECYLLIRLFRRPDLPKLFGSTAFTTRTLRFAWHLTTVIAWGLAAVVLQVGDLPDADGRRIALILAVTLTVLAAGGLIRSQLYDLSPYDPASIGLAAALLMAVALVAGFLPARRAACALAPMA